MLKLLPIAVGVWIHSALGHTMAVKEFLPSHEWQFVPEDVAIPGGLDVKMDLENGGRWARYLPQSEPDHKAEAPAVVTITETPKDLDSLEEKAYDHDDGAMIVQQYGHALFTTFADSNNKHSDQAGRILAICLRNNRDAAQSIAPACPDLFSALGLNKRSLSILSSLVSTKEGLAFVKAHDALENMRQLVASSATLPDPAVPRYLTILLENLVIVGEDGEEFCRWVDALQQAYYTTNVAEFKDLAVDIVKHNGEFEALSVECKPQPGLLPQKEEVKRAVQSADRFANPKAARNHFDEL